MRSKFILMFAFTLLLLPGFSFPVHSENGNIVLQVKSGAVYTDGVIPERCEGACYKNIQDAMSVAESGDTIQLAEDLTQEASINDDWGIEVTLPEVTLDLNGHLFKDGKNLGSAFKIAENAGLIIKNSGSSETGSIQATAGKTCITIQKGGKLTFLSGEIKNSRSTGKVIENNGAMTMYGGTITGGGVAIFSQGTFGDPGDYTEIYDGVVSSGKNNAVLMSSGTFCIYGGRIKCSVSKACFKVTNESLCCIRIRGGLFNVDVSERCSEETYTCCANDQEETAEEYPWKVVSDKKVRVEGICAVIDDSGGLTPSENFGNVLGTGTYCTGDRIVLTAPVKTGWQFIGWYRKEDDTWTSISQDRPYGCVLFPEENILVAAGYTKSETASVTVHVEGNDYTISGTLEQDGTYDAGQDFICNFGSEISLTSENEESFQYWLNDSDKIIAKERSYVFTAARDMTVKEHRYNQEDLQTRLEFFSAQHQLLRSKIEDGLSTIAFPSFQPAGAGKIFAGWIFSDTLETAEEESILNRINAFHPGNITVLPKEESAGDTCDITLVYEQKRDPERFAGQTVGEKITITADSKAYSDEDKFAYWTDGSNRILSFSEIFQMYALSDQSLTVRCVDQDEETANIPVLNWQDTGCDQKGDGIHFRLTTIRTVPDDFQVLDHGILCAADSGQDLTLSDTQAVRLISSDLSRNGSFTGELYGEPGAYGETGLFCRGFMIVRKSSTIYILYTEIQHVI